MAAAMISGHQNETLPLIIRSWGAEMFTMVGLDTRLGELNTKWAVTRDETRGSGGAGIFRYGSAGQA